MTASPEDRARLVNRHMARILFDLEEADCPRVYRDAVRACLVAAHKGENLRAPLVAGLEEARCPAIYVDAIRRGLDWLEEDLREAGE